MFQARNQAGNFSIESGPSFDDPGPSGVESGLAELIRPEDCPTYSGKTRQQIAKSKNRVPKCAASDPRDIKYVVFHRSRMLHLDVPLKDADLRYFYGFCT